MKWLWRYDTGEPSLWKEVGKNKHGESDHWSTKISNAPYGVGPWKPITKLGSDFFWCTYYIPGKGAHIRFWKDKWLNGTTPHGEVPL